MNKAFLLFLCLLVCMPPVVAQQRIPPPRTPSPAAQQPRGATPEQRERIRQHILALIDERRARELAIIRKLLNEHPAPAVRPVPTPEQPSLGGWVFRPSAVVPPGPIPTLSDVPAVGDWGVSSLKGVDLNNGPQFWSKADEAKFDLNMEAFDRNMESLKLDIEELKRILAAPNPPAVPRSASPALPPLPKAVAASAASHKPSDMRTLDKNDLPPSGRLIVRSGPHGFYIGSLDTKDKKVFRVDAVYKYINKKGQPVYYARGYAYGDINLPNVWVDYDGLSKRDKNVPAPRLATDAEVPDFGLESRRYLKKRFASIIAPENHDKDDGKLYAVVTQDTELYGNYPLYRHANSDGAKPPPGDFSDPIGAVLARPCYEFKVRYFSNDGNAVVGRLILRDPKDGKTVMSSQWGILPTAAIGPALSDSPPPCKQ